MVLIGGIQTPNMDSTTQVWCNQERCCDGVQCSPDPVDGSHEFNLNRLNLFKGKKSATCKQFFILFFFFLHWLNIFVVDAAKLFDALRSIAELKNRRVRLGIEYWLRVSIQSSVWLEKLWKCAYESVSGVRNGFIHLYTRRMNIHLNTLKGSVTSDLLSFQRTNEI